MFIMYVKNPKKMIRILRLVETKNRIYYLFVYHPELNIFENILVNMGMMWRIRGDS